MQKLTNHIKNSILVLKVVDKAKILTFHAKFAKYRPGDNTVKVCLDV